MMRRNVIGENPLPGSPDAKVNVILRNGNTGKGWAAKTTRWNLTGHEFDVIEHQFEEE